MATAFSRNTMPMAMATESGRARMIGASVAIAVPPQIAVPVLSNRDWSSSALTNRPMTRPAIRVPTTKVTMSAA